MDFNTSFGALEKRASDSFSAVKAAAHESRDKLRQRMDQAQVDIDLAEKDAKDRVAQASDRAQSNWAQLKADAAATREDIKKKIEKRNLEHDATVAEREAGYAEADAADAIDYADWAIVSARLAVLDALDARVYADERAKAAANAP